MLVHDKYVYNAHPSVLLTNQITPMVDRTINRAKYCEAQDSCTCCPIYILFIYLVSGRFDLDWPVYACQSCNTKVSIDMDAILKAGYWPGSSNQLNYLFDSNLFRMWDRIQKRLPGSSENSFIKVLADISSSNGSVSFHFKLP